MDTLQKRLFTNEESECNHEDVYTQEGLTICRDCGRETCEHSETEDVDGIPVCLYCGLELSEVSFEDKDWKYYSSGSRKDPTRCHRRRESTKSIFSYVEGMAFVHSIVANANKKYIKIKDDAHRGKNNKAVITACLYAAYIDEGDPKPVHDIGIMFGLNKKNISKGMDTFFDHFPDYRTKYIQPSDLIRRIIIKTGIDMSHYTNIRKLCKHVENSSSAINSSTPQSVACAVVYLYVCMFPDLKERIGLTKQRFTSMVGMSDITISKICRFILEVINQDIKL